MKYACGLVSYFPDEKVISKIINYTKSFDFIFVFDNTPLTKSKIDLAKKLQSYTKVKVLDNNRNLGLSNAYAYFVSSSENNFDFLCLLDQDSIFSACDIINMKQFIEKQANRDNIAIFSPRVIYKEKRVCRKNTYKEKKFVISSGSFINLKLVKTDSAIFFDRNYFIDRVDMDFCRKCINEQYKIIVYNNSLLYQKLGSDGVVRQHSYIRHYYIFRNRFYYNQKYERRYKLVTSMQVGKQCLRILIGEKDKLRKLTQLFIAYIDFRKGLMGRGRY